MDMVLTLSKKCSKSIKLLVYNYQCIILFMMKLINAKVMYGCVMENVGLSLLTMGSLNVPGMHHPLSKTCGLSRIRKSVEVIL